MSNHVPLNGLIKIENDGNTLIQSYINTFNKEIEKNDPSLQDINEDENPLQDMDSNDGLEISAVPESIQIEGKTSYKIHICNAYVLFTERFNFLHKHRVGYKNTVNELRTSITV